METKLRNYMTLQEKKDIGEGHACDGPLWFVTNVTYGDDP